MTEVAATSTMLTKVCRQVWHMMFFAASLTFVWLLAVDWPLAALRSRFCCALAPY